MRLSMALRWTRWRGRSRKKYRRQVAAFLLLNFFVLRLDGWIRPSVLGMALVSVIHERRHIS